MDADEQVPRHFIVVEQEGDDFLMHLECPFGNSTYVSNYPTVSDTWFDDDFGVDTSAWPPPWTGFIERLGQIEDGYCSYDWQGIRPLLRMKHYGCVIEMQPVASGFCRIESEIEQVGLDELIDTVLFQEGRYPVIWWEEGWGENFSCGLELESYVPQKR
jgi:hypothetical protein